MSEWMPIATAPKDGSHFFAILTVRNSALRIERMEFYVISIDEETHEVSHYGEYVGWDLHDFTHWMPLPEPPK